MRLTSLSHEGFRNLAADTTALSPATTVLLGDNGQGKTSFLEAIGVLATAKSFRRARAAEMAADGAVAFSLRGTVEDAAGRATDLALAWADGRRATAVGRAPAELAEYIAHLTVVPITQEHAAILRGGPQDRRDFLDRGLLGVRPSYLRSLAAYRRSLRQVNALLRTSATGSRRMQLDAWLDRLARDAAELTWRRRLYVVDLVAALAEVGPVFQPASEALGLSLRDVVSRESGGSEPAEPPGRDAVRELLQRRLGETLERSLARGQVVTGPHRDDLVIEIAGHDARRHASSGQQRNALLALKMAKVEVFRRHRGETPVLLIDDVDTEIDARRLDRFLEAVGGRSQAVLTSSKTDLFAKAPEGSALYRVEEGTIRPL